MNRVNLFKLLHAYAAGAGLDSPQIWAEGTLAKVDIKFYNQDLDEAEAWLDLSTVHFGTALGAAFGADESEVNKKVMNIINAVVDV
jgi:hypothetical protein